MATQVIPQVMQLAQMNVFTANMHPAGKLKLIKAPIVFTPFLTPADFSAIEADYTGYAAIVITDTLNSYPDAVNGGVSAEVPTKLFQCGSALTVGNNIYGGWIEDTTGAILCVGFQWLDPIPMQESLAALPLALIFNQFGTNDLRAIINGVPV